ncbi:hypothetical protein Mgra_00006131 [Meloidogyne graminicola]|uniref:Uncharacterized protein n=1 Tax=Meloidogyne graminicola TaxID=189291 RepID=A0A8S9ZMM6_9BILA|nr:hypothetical protein Mgra_00006131 [Meloidogyne graminicola]
MKFFVQLFFITFISAMVFIQNINALKCYWNRHGEVTTECFGKNAMCRTVECGWVVARCCTTDPNWLCGYNKDQCKDCGNKRLEEKVEHPKIPDFPRPKPGPIPEPDRCLSINDCTTNLCNKV